MPIVNPNQSRQAIVTRYHGPTATRSSRISAQCQAGSLSLPLGSFETSRMSIDETHAYVAEQLMRKLAWFDENWAQGGLPQGDGYVFVNIGRAG